MQSNTVRLMVRECVRKSQWGLRKRRLNRFRHARMHNQNQSALTMPPRHQLDFLHDFFLPQAVALALQVFVAAVQVA